MIPNIPPIELLNIWEQLIDAMNNGYLAKIYTFNLHRFYPSLDLCEGEPESVNEKEEFEMKAQEVADNLGFIFSLFEKMHKWIRVEINDKPFKEALALPIYDSRVLVKVCHMH